ncbi:hypothetical protein SLS53_000332 [Cytospora paraplurivora]|uniref:Xylanolytic transcriptional activator regulatory domain-containing protein n=1 Tax=Cytospora paraplurivora TaxID=2898453 RepID=A0AAN9UXE9_9PEZI
MAQPTLMNQPPQIFGAHAYDGMQMQNLSPELTAQMFGDATMLLDDSNEAKRRRIARVSPAGSGCLLDEEDGATDLGTLEKKLAEKKEESRQASQAAQSSPTSPSQATSGHDASELTPRSSLTSLESPKDADDRRKSMDGKQQDKESEEVEALSEMMCSLVTNTSGETRYIGSSSGFSIFSPMGIQWVNERTGDKSFQSMISHVSMDDHKWNNWKPEVFADLFQRPVFLPLPPKQEATSLLHDYFDNFNCMFPLFHRPTFMQLLEMQYSKDPYAGSGWWASLNVALAIAHRLRVMSNLVPHEEEKKAWGYMKNAMACFAELSMRNTDLLSVQALLGMALFMQGTPNPQPSSLLIGTAIRLSHNIGLHKRGTGFNLNPIEIEQRKRVFWIAYMLDKDLCIRSGRPFAQDDDDMNVELPSGDPEDNIGNIPLADGKGKMNLFRIMCELALIESKVYKRLYATKATKQTDGELLQTIGELDQELEDWKDRMPIEYRPEHEIQASHTPLILHVVMLHFTYYNCLTTIHRMSIHRGYWTSRLSNFAIQGLNSKPLNPRVFNSAALCTSAARASISLLKYIPQGDSSVVWLMNMVVTFLSALGQEIETGGVHRMLGICSEFERISKVMIEKAEKDNVGRKKRKNAEPSQANKPASNTQLTTPSSSSSPPAPSNQSSSSTRTERPATATKDDAPRQRQNDNLQPPSHPEGQGFSPMTTPSQSHSTSPGHPPPGWATDFSANDPMEFASFAELTGFGQLHDGPPPPPLQSPPVPGLGFPQQPLIPQDLYALPMSFDWDWAEMSGGAYPSVENGNFGEQR